MHQTNQSTLPTMKKIQILNWILRSLILLTFLATCFSVYIFISLYNSPPIDYSKVFPAYLPYTTILSGALFLVAMIYLQLSVNLFIKQGFFNTKSSGYLKLGAIFLALFGLTDITIATINNAFKANYDLLDYLNNNSSHIVTLIVTIGIFIVADIIKSGVTIKQENDLTI